MHVLEVGEMPCGTKIQIENWNGEYDFMPVAATLEAYPVSKVDMDGQFAPKKNRTFRAAFTFDSEMEARQAFEQLKKGTKKLLDFTEFITNPKKLNVYRRFIK